MCAWRLRYGLVAFIMVWVGISAGAKERLDWNSDFSGTNWFDVFNAWRKPPKVTGLDRVTRVMDPERKHFVLRIAYPQGCFGLHCDGAHWRTYLDGPHERLKFAYDVKFAPGFDFVQGGKLPGLGGGHKDGEPDAFVAGGDKPTGKNGWSARVMWRENGEAETYVYHPDQPGVYGERMHWKVRGEPVHFIPGRWHRIALEVRLNDPAKKDGEIRTWLDGVPVLERTGLRFRTVAGLAIDSIHFATFFGGDDASWAPKKDEAVFFDAFALEE